MTIPVSTVDAVKDYLVAQIQALSVVKTPVSGLDPVLVQYDVIGKYEPEEWIEVGEIIEQQADIHAMVGSGATGWLSERFRITLTISCWRGGDDASATWKRANAISQAIDTMIRTDPSLGGNVKVAHPASFRSESGWDKDGKGRKVQIQREIECFAIV